MRDEAMQLDNTSGQGTLAVDDDATGDRVSIK